MSSSNNLESAHELEHNTSNESNNITVDNIQRYIKKSKIQNTDAYTQKWVRSLQEYHMKRQDGKSYKPESIVSAYTSLRRYLFEGSAIKNVNINDRFQFPVLYRVVDGKIIELQDQELGNIDQSKGLTTEEIRQIMSYLKSGNMMKEIARASGINVDDQRITNHLGRITAIQLLSDLNVNEHKMMQFSESPIIQQESQIIHQESQVMQHESQVMQQESP
ncbi:5281_t:CDS:2, partial [Dentiscutata heterogama]